MNKTITKSYFNGIKSHVKYFRYVFKINAVQVKIKHNKELYL